MNKRSTTSRGRRTSTGDLAPQDFLIETTIDSLAELGFAGTTLAKIAGRAGLSADRVEHHFGDKQGLLEAA